MTLFDNILNIRFCIGDAKLLNIVLDNLIGNAWKYSDNLEGTVIEFGVTERDGKPA